MSKNLLAFAVFVSLASGAQAITTIPGASSGAPIALAAANNGGFTTGTTGLGTGPGILNYQTIKFSFGANEAVRLSFDMAGNPNGDGSEVFAAGFVFSAPTALAKFDPGGALGNVAVETNLNVPSYFVSGNIADSAGFTRYVIDFVSAQAGSVVGLIQTGSFNGQGPRVTGRQIGGFREEALLPPPPDPPPLEPIPEPDIWALLIIGFGLTGAMMRRRSKALAA
ncbi:MAG: PEPxxWA-CTERM sorting domain-containing protein [Polymorphobacter sp.]